MARRTDYPNRVFNPALVGQISTTEVGVEIRDSIICKNYLNPSYENLATTEPHDKHQYEDLPQLRKQMSIENRLSCGSGPRRKRNEVYESTSDLSPLKKNSFLRSRHTDTECSEDSIDGNIPRDPCISRLILLLVLAVSATSLVLVILMMLGILGAKCDCIKKTGEGSTLALSGEWLAHPQNKFENVIMELMKNVSALQKNLVFKEKKIEELETRLAAQDAKIKNVKAQTKTVKNTTVKGSLVEFIQRQEFQISLDKLNTTINRLEDEKQRVVHYLNSTDISLNKTVKQLQEEDLKIRSSLTTKLDTISKNVEALEEKFNNVSLQKGPRGPRGFNGSQGPTGPQGSGDLSNCTYKTKSSSFGGDDMDISYNPGQNEVIMGATCSNSDDSVKAFNQLSYIPGRDMYKCRCIAPGENNYKCVINFWSCPKKS